MTDIVTHQRMHDLAFHQSGRIDISRSVATALGLQRDDVIGVAREDGEYVLYVKARAGEYVGRYQGRVYPTNHRSHNFRAYCVGIARAVIRACGRTDTVRLFAGGEVRLGNGVDGVCIITRNPQ